MRDSVKNLRKARRAYYSARQIRYDELAKNIEDHDAIVWQINIEEQAAETEHVAISASYFIRDDTIFEKSWTSDPDTPLFDIS